MMPMVIQEWHGRLTMVSTTSLTTETIGLGTVDGTVDGDEEVTAQSSLDNNMPEPELSGGNVDDEDIRCSVWWCGRTWWIRE
jgi:hypothetical protein